MTDPSHLDDEALSAVLDGEAAAEESAHVDECETCRTRLGALRDASVLVGTPVPPPDPARREAAIAAALETRPRVAEVRTLRRRTPPTWLAAAAAVVVALIGIALVLPDDASEHDDGGDASTALSDDDSGAAASEPSNDVRLAPMRLIASAIKYVGSTVEKTAIVSDNR